MKQRMEIRNLGVPGIRLEKSELCKEEQGRVRMSKKNEEEQEVSQEANA